MAFGQELRDFVSGFQGGYQLIKSPEEKQREREKWQMEKDKFARDGEWHDDEKSYRDKKFDYDASRDSVRDTQWQKQFDFGERQQNFREKQQGRDDEFRSHEIGQRDEALRLKRREQAVKARESNREPDNFDSFMDGEKTPEAIPQSYDDSAADNQSMLQNASYTPGGFNLRSYLRSIRSAESGGDDRAKNPESTATGRYQVINSTWRGYMNKYPELRLTRDGRFDGEQQERFIRRFTYDNGLALDKAGLPVNNGTMYAAHFLGSDGAITVLRSSNDTPMSAVVDRGTLKANKFLRNMTVGDFKRWVQRKGNIYSPKSEETAIGAASGGLITAIPEDAEEQQRVAEDALMQQRFNLVDDEESEAIPDNESAEVTSPGNTEGAIPDRAPAYEGKDVSEGDKEPATDDPYELGRRAVRDGLKRTIKDMRLESEGAIDEQDMEKAYENYVRGYGAAPDQLMRQALDRVDPEKKMSPAERNFKAMGAVYRYYMEQGKTEEAQKAASSMVQYYRQTSSKFLAIAQSAAEEGDIDDAAQAAMAAYANIPNGRDLKIEKNEDGSYNVSVTDAKTGKEVSKKVLSPRDLAAAAMQFSPKTFDDEILNAAGVPGDKIERTKGENDTSIREGVKASAEEMWPDDAENPVDASTRNTMADTAGQIATITNNGMGTDEALRFVDITNPTPFDKPRTVRGNPDMVELSRDGISVIVPKGYANKLLKAWSERVKADAKTVADNKKSAEDKAALVEEGKNAIGAIWENEKDAFRKNLDQLKEQWNAGTAKRGKTDPLTGLEEGAVPDSPPDSAKANPTGRAKELLDARQQILSSADPEMDRASLDAIEQELIQMGYLTERTPVNNSTP